MAGLCLGYAVLKSRALPVSMTWHASYNASLLALSLWPQLFAWAGVSEAAVSPLTGVLGLAGAATALRLIERAPLSSRQ
jgi:membrane protease YdiL (CAAX protease family)